MKNICINSETSFSPAPAHIEWVELLPDVLLPDSWLQTAYYGFKLLLPIAAAIVKMTKNRSRQKRG